MILEALLAEVRAFEVSEQQATDIESPGARGANVLLLPKSETPDKAARCFNYEKIGNTMPKLDVLLGIERAISAKNMAIMRSIVEVWWARSD